jgi:phosphate-selective porin OprO/OprP
VDFDDLLWRRFRFGFKSQLAGGWVVQLEGDFDLNESRGDWYNRLTDAYVGWQPGEEIDLRILKHSAGFTLDGATSSKKLLTLQRNNIPNNLWFTDEYFTGVSAKGVLNGSWHYQAGVFSADGDDEISIAEGGHFVLTSLGYDWADGLDMDKAFLRLDYVYNKEDRESSTRDFSNVITLASKWERGDWGLWTDLTAGRGHFEQSDIWGISLMPFYDQSPLVQWVGRYTYMDSEDANGLSLGRYEREIEVGRGDRYKEIYAGLNLFFYGHKLKWQTGLQYTIMDDVADDGGKYEGWGLTSGFRISW